MTKTDEQPGFGVALAAVAVAAATSSWFFVALAGAFESDMGSQVDYLLSSVVGGFGVKLLLRVLGYDVSYPTAVIALVAGSVVGIVVIHAVPGAGEALPVLPVLGLASGIPSLLVSAFIIQMSAGRGQQLSL